MSVPASPVVFSVADTLARVDPAAWNRLAGEQPLLAHAYLHALHETGCASAATGWKPRFLLGTQNGELVAAMPLYLKMHSYGEYVFDWAWADAYRRHGRRYYPKLLGAVPFTPATGSRLLARDPAHRIALWKRAVELAGTTRASSLHVLFPDPAEAASITGPGILHRHGIQFCWSNHDYENFDGFLATFSHDKRKKIKQDRTHVAREGIAFRWLDGTTAREADWDFFYRCYQSTYAAHHSSPYLTREFFLAIAQSMPQNLLLVIGEREGRPHCAALNIHNDHTLWGRYWGTIGFVSGLHFETCYYQAIEYCIAKRIARFEGGAQGGHKLARGFLPVRTHSLHW
ncbi:MAG: GNAT family N-acetyltransferase, partial [Betaproteobacteria bacterium]